MKVSINQYGMITLKSESGWEDFALQVWQEKSTIPAEDEKRMLGHYLHPGYLQIQLQEKDAEE